MIGKVTVSTPNPPCQFCGGMGSHHSAKCRKTKYHAEWCDRMNGGHECNCTDFEPSTMTAEREADLRKRCMADTVDCLREIDSLRDKLLEAKTSAALEREGCAQDLEAWLIGMMPEFDNPADVVRARSRKPNPNPKEHTK